MNAIAILGSLAAALALLNGRVVARTAGPLTADQVRRLAADTVRRTGFNADPKMLVAMAFIESSFNPDALRPEPHINDASAGLMQTLEQTAQWLHDDFPRYRYRERPTLSGLMTPQMSMHFGAAYVDYLARFRGVPRSEEFIVRGYNGGPDGINRSATAHHWRKYLQARERFG